MFGKLSRVRSPLAAPALVLVAGCFLTVAAAAFASGPPYGIPSGVLQPDWSKYRGYQELYHGVRPAHPEPASVTEAPSQSYLHITHPKVKHDADDRNQVIFMAHVPEDAVVFFDDAPTRQKGKIRWFETPPLAPDHDYNYSVRLVWNEGGKWVSQTRKVSLRAGEVHCVDLMPVSSKEMQAEIAANLAKLSPEDRKRAEAQKFCVVQNDKRLGEMGVPVKIMVKDQPVFLCCDGCERRALADPARTLAEAERLKKQSKDGAAAH